jgi:hypothetical protein
MVVHIPILFRFCSHGRDAKCFASKNAKRFPSIFQRVPNVSFPFGEMKWMDLTLKFGGHMEMVVVVNQLGSYTKYPKYLEYKEIHLG